MNISRLVVAVSLGLIGLSACKSGDEPRPAHLWDKLGERVKTRITIFEPGELPYESSTGPHAASAKQPRFWLLDENETLHLDLLRRANPQLAPLKLGYEAQVFTLGERLAYQISRRTQVNPHLGAGGYPDYTGTLTIFDPQTFRIEKQITFDSYMGQGFATLLFALEPSTIYAHYHGDRRTFEVSTFTGKRGAQVAALDGFSFEAAHKYGDEIWLYTGHSLVSWRPGADTPITADLGGYVHRVATWADDLAICNVDRGGPRVAIYSLRERRLLTPLLDLGGRIGCAYYDRHGGLYYAYENGTDRDMVYRADLSHLLGRTSGTASVSRQSLAHVRLDMSYLVAGVHSLYVSPDNRRLYALYTYGVPVYSQARIAIYDLDVERPEYPLVARRTLSVDKIYRPRIWQVAQP